MTGADKVVCQAATLLLLFTLTTVPAKAQFAGFGGGGGGDMMTQMAPMLEMMKAKMGKRRFAMLMQTMGPMMSQMMEGGGGGLGGMIGGGGIPGGFGGGGIPGGFGGGTAFAPEGYGIGMGGGDIIGHARRRRWRRNDEHDSATDADGQCRRRARPPASPAALEHCAKLHRSAHRARSAIGWRPRLPQPRARFGPHRVRTTLAADSTPSTTIDAAASAKKFAGVGMVHRQPPAAGGHEHQPRGLRQHRSENLRRSLRGKIHRDRQADEGVHRRRGRQILPAGGAHAGVAGEDVDPEIGEDRDHGGNEPDRHESNAARDPAQSAARARRGPAPIAIPTIGTDAIPTANAIEVSMNSSRAPMP